MTSALTVSGVFIKDRFDNWKKIQDRKRLNRERLIELAGILKECNQDFLSQLVHVKRLQESLSHSTNTQPLIEDGKGYAYNFEKIYEHMSVDQKQTLALIRSITINSLMPANSKALEWLKDNRLLLRALDNDAPELAEQCKQLYRHLSVWNAKFNGVLLKKECSAIVFLGDEQADGIGFPTALEPELEKYLIPIGPTREKLQKSK